MHQDLSVHINEAVNKYFHSEDYRDQVLKGKNIYFEMTGMVDERATDYEHRMQMFNDWFLFDYISDQRQVSYMTEYLNEINMNDENVRAALQNVHYSVYEYTKKMFSKNMILRDFISGERFELTPENFPFGILPGEIIVGRVVQYQNDFFPLSGVRYIPKELKSLISKEAKTIKKKGNPSEERKFILAIERFKTRCEQYSHIDPVSVFKKFGLTQ